MIKTISFIILVLVLSTFAYSTELKINKKISYPYKATEEKTKRIEIETKKITLGMSGSEVIGILGEPDETHPLYEPKIKQPTQIGYTHWYLIQRLKENGSVIEKQEKAVRITYDLDWTVIGINLLGLR